MADNEGMNQEPLTPKKTIRLKPLQSRIAPANTAAAPAETAKPATTGAGAPGSSVNVIPGGAQQTIRLRPSVSGTGAAPEVSQHKTIRLVPKKPAVSAASDAPASAPASADAPASAAAPTLKLDGSASSAAKPTIKLQSAGSVSSGTPGEAASSQPTIKLGNSNASSQPTIKLGDSNASSQPTIKLGNSNASSQPTIRLGNAGSAGTGDATPNTNTIKLNSGASPLQIKKLDNNVSNVPHSARNVPTQKKTEDEPSSLFLVSGIVALLLLGACVFVMAAQYLNFFEGKNIDVPGLERKVTNEVIQ